ncbi:hypothetical protein AB6E30_06610 [Vibrio sp. 10N.247.311.12]|uniref:hypothetical protein n=1 Tax=Vibrio sp. 10N.247.311.12 TaxID=3229991 RepID=UPI0035538729
MKNILLLTDSLGYPRMSVGSPSASNVWTYRLARKLKGKYNFFFDIKTGRTTSEIVDNLLPHFAAYQAEVIIIQVGIVDCYPRALSKIELQVISRIPILNSFFKMLIKKYYKEIINLRKINYVDEGTFENNIRDIKSFFCNSQVIFLPIAPPNKKYCNINPLVELNISKYNSILSKVVGEQCDVSFFDDLDAEKAYVSDNHHFSDYGHAYTYKKLLGDLA